MIRTPIEDIIAAYRETGSVWKAGKTLGLAGQTVHERLRAIDYPLNGRKWTDEETDELRALLAQGVPAGEVAHRLGRTFPAVTCRMNELDLRVQRRPKAAKIPRGAGYDKASIAKHIGALERSGQPPTKYCRSHGLNIEPFVQACQRHFPERWAAHIAATSAIPEQVCGYCGTTFVPANGKQEYCTRRCASTARTDASYFGGKRRSTVGLAEGVCQLCGAYKTKGLSSHHVLGKENDPENDNLIALCAGCHKIITLVATRNFIDDAAAWETLIQLAWLRKHGPEIAAGKFDGHATYVFVEVEVDDEEDLSDLDPEDLAVA